MKSKQPCYKADFFNNANMRRESRIIFGLSFDFPKTPVVKQKNDVTLNVKMERDVVNVFL